MTNMTMGSLRELQALDERIQEVRAAMRGFDDRIAQVEEPTLALEAELKALQERLAQMKSDARRLERAADDKRARAEKAEQRLTKVVNLREESAVRTELDLIRKAIEGDEQEALQLIDQVRRTEGIEEELRTRAEQSRIDLERSQKALLEERGTLDELLLDLQSRRSEVLKAVGAQHLKVYESFHQSGRAVVVSQLLEDGACGNCFGVIPLQLQQEVRAADALIRCEGCGVILTSEPAPDLDPALTQPLQLSDPETFGEAQEAEGGEAEDEVADESEASGEAGTA